MVKNFIAQRERLWSRSQLLKLGLAAGGLGVAGLIWQRFNTQMKSAVRVPPMETESVSDTINPWQILQNFDYGRIKQENGRTIREFQLTAGTSTIQLNSAVDYNIWDLNGRIPGPTLRAKQGERVLSHCTRNQAYCQGVIWNVYCRSP